MADRVGRLVQFPVADLLAPEGDGDRPWGGPGLPLEALQDGERRIVLGCLVERPQPLRLARRQRGVLRAAVRVGGHRLQDLPVQAGQPVGVLPGQGVGVRGQQQVPGDRGDREGELGAALAAAGLGVDQFGVDVVEVLVAEADVEEPAGPGVALDDWHREAPAVPDVPFGGEHLPYQVGPGAPGSGEGERQCVEVHAVHPLGARRLGARAAHQAAVEGGFLGEQGEDLQVGGEQDALQRHLGLRGERAQPG